MSVPVLCDEEGEHLSSFKDVWRWKSPTKRDDVETKLKRPAFALDLRLPSLAL